MLFLYGTTEPYSRTFVVTAHIAFHDWRNQAEPSGTMARAQNEFALPHSFMMYLLSPLIMYIKRYYTIALTRVAVVTESPRSDDKAGHLIYLLQEVTMGLDANAGYVKPTKEQQDNVVDINSRDNYETPYYWRKHARMQQFMMELWHKKKEEDAPFGVMGSDFNCGSPINLTREDITTLLKLVENDDLPFCPDGFFWGHQFQEQSCKDYKEQDLAFCVDALQWLDEGKEVFYECSW